MNNSETIVIIRPNTIYPNGFIIIASINFPLIIATTERVEPHAGQGIPNIHSMGQKSIAPERDGNKRDKSSQAVPRVIIIEKNR